MLHDIVAKEKSYVTFEMLRKKGGKKMESKAGYFIFRKNTGLCLCAYRPGYKKKSLFFAINLYLGNMVATHTSLRDTFSSSHSLCQASNRSNCKRFGSPCGRV